MRRAHPADVGVGAEVGARAQHGHAGVGAKGAAANLVHKLRQLRVGAAAVEDLEGGGKGGN